MAMPKTTEPPKDRFCDLVMKGGITSGVAYPKAIAELAKHYRFKSIGGTSAGAIAAAITAAAEFRRRHTQTRDGFDILENLPENLMARLPGGKRSRLLSLFQAQPQTSRLFSVLLCSLNRGGTYRRLAWIVGGILYAYWPATLMSVVATVAAWQAGLDGSAAVLLLLVMLVTTIAAALYLDITRNIVKNGFGLCTGMTEEKDHPALTPWLHDLIQRTAGLKPGEPPLTFGQLWDAPDFPPPWLHRLPKANRRSIDLQMFSTNLGHGRPYLFPLQVVVDGPSRFRDRERLFFSAKELARYLPADVLSSMISCASPYQIEPGRENLDPDAREAEELGLLTLPAPKDFPVILAARMSLSFPILFSAVPLWSIDYDAPRGQRHFRRCWFSDGGISSNFPMHLFDGLIPAWPTFGINLEPEIKGREMIFLPKRYEEGYGEKWDNFDRNARSASRFGGFIAAILGTMQNWNDNTLSRMPGVRDRIARVRLAKGEGGLNLNMSARDIEAIANRGKDAALELIARFAPDAVGGNAARGWDEQRFVRLNLLLKLIEARVAGIATAMDPACPHSTDFDTLIKRATKSGAPPNSPPPPGYETLLTQAQEKTLRDALEKLAHLAAGTDAETLEIGFKPIPKPELRVRPPL